MSYGTSPGRALTYVFDTCYSPTSIGTPPWSSLQLIRLRFMTIPHPLSEVFGSNVALKHLFKLVTLDFISLIWSGSWLKSVTHESYDTFIIQYTQKSVLYKTYVCMPMYRDGGKICMIDFNQIRY